MFDTALRVGAAYFTGGASEAVRAGVDALNEHNLDNQPASEVRNYEAQKEFAQNGIRWKVADAKAAGLHPLAALGAQTMGYSPSGFGDSGSQMAREGQDISRMISAASTAEERNTAKIAATLNLEHMELSNDLLRSQIARMNSAQVGPPLPSPGIASGTPGVKMQPAKVTASSTTNPARQAGAINDYGYARTETGLTVVPSSDVKERIEDQVVPEAMWAFRNNILPSISGLNPPSTADFPLPEGMYWDWNPRAQEFQPKKRPDFNKYLKDQGNLRKYGVTR